MDLSAAPRPVFGSLPPHVPLPRSWRAVALVIGALLLGVLGGLAVLALGPLAPFALLLGAVAGVLVLAEPRWGLLGALGVIALLPFGTLPVKVGVTLTLLELALALTWAVFALRLLLRRDEQLLTTALDGPVVLFVVMTVFSFVLGVGRGYTAQTLHDYAKMVLSISLFILVTNLLRTRRDLRLGLASLLAGGGLAAVLGIGLYALGRGAERFLLQLAAVGYPTSKVLRYIEDDPAKPLRATGTSVDPNSFAGLLMVVLLVAVGQATARRPLVPRALAVVVTPPLALALLLTQSRATWLGAACGVVFLALLRYRWLLLPLVLGALTVRALGIGASFIERLTLGFQLQDPATKLRLAEYRNALAIVREHPWFGVGFGAAPSIDLQAGVSSIYLTIAERMGLLGLAVFGVVLAILALRLWPVLRRPALRESAAGEATLALSGALVAGLAAGVLDHYFFNIAFAHMVAVFWGLIALALVAARQAEADATGAATADRTAR